MKDLLTKIIRESVQRHINEGRENMSDAAFQIYSMLVNNDTDWYNALWDTLIKKVRRGVALSPETLAQSSTVMAKAKKYARILRDGCNMGTIPDDITSGAMEFAVELIDNLNDTVKSENEKAEQEIQGLSESLSRSIIREGKLSTSKLKPAIDALSKARGVAYKEDNLDLYWTLDRMVHTLIKIVKNETGEGYLPTIDAEAGKEETDKPF